MASGPIEEAFVDVVPNFGRFGSALETGTASALANMEQRIANQADDIVDPLRVAFEGLEDDLLNLSAFAEREFADVEHAAQQAASEVESSFETAISGIETDFDGLADQADVTGQQITESIDGEALGSEIEAGSQRGISALGALGAAGAAAVAAMAVVGLQASVEIEATTDRLAAALALTPEQAEQYGDIASNIYASAWGDSIDEVNIGLESIASTLGKDLPTDQLEQLTTSALALSDAFEIDVSRAANAAGSLITQGLAEDGTQALDLLTAGFQNVPAELREDLIDATNEYGQFFSQLGLNGEQAFAILTDASAGGTIQLDKTGDALKEFTIRATDMSATSVAAYEALGLSAGDMANDILAGGDTSSAAFQQIVDQLLAIEDPATQANTAIALFGTPLEDLGTDKIPEFLAGLDQMDTGLAGTEGAADQLAATLSDNLSTRLTELKRTGELALADFGNAVLGPAIESVLPVLQDVAGTLGTALAPLGDALGGAVAGIAEALVGMAPLITTLIGLVTPFVDIIANTLGTVGPIIADALGAALTALTPLVTLLSQTLGGVIESLAPVLATLGTVFADIVQTVVTTVMPIFEALAPVFLSLLDAVLPVITMLAETLGGLLADILPPLGAAIGSIVEALAPLIPPIVELAGTLIDALLPVLSQIIGVVVEVAAVLAGALGEALGTIFEALAPIIPVIGEVASALGGALLAVFQALAPVLPALAEAIGLIAGSLAQVLAAVLPLLTPLLQLVTLLIERIGVPVLTALATAIAALLTPIAQLVAQLAEFLTPILTTVANLLSEGLTIAIDAVTQVIGLLVAKGVEFGAWLADTLQPVLGFIKLAFDAWWQSLDPVRSLLEWVWNSVLVPLVGFMRDHFLVVLDGAKLAFDFLAQAVQPVIDLVMWLWNNVLAPIAEFIAGTFTDAIDGAALLWEGLGTAVQVVVDVFDVFMGVIEDVVGWLETMQDLLDAVLGLIGDALGKIADLGNSVIGGVIGSIPGFAHGAIVDGPTLAVFGEAGREAAVPLDDERSGVRVAVAAGIPEMLARAGLIGGTQVAIGVTVEPPAGADENWARRMGQIVGEEAGDAFVKTMEIQTAVRTA